MTALPELRDALTSGVARRRTRYRRRAGSVMAAGLLAAAFALFALAAPSGGPEQALAIVGGPDVIELRIADATADAAQMTRELHAAGVPGEVRTVPVASAHVGTWVAASEVPRGEPRPVRVPEDEATLRDQLRLGEIERTADLIRIPTERIRDAATSFVFYAGRAARPYERPIDVAREPIPTDPALGNQRP